ncbi:hypothetical protein ACOSP7_010744 [Xanthoceras sorbifolium]
METNQQQTTRDIVVDKRLLQEGNSKLKQEGFGASKQQQQQQQSATAPASPPSSSSSPSHEFSFTISLHSSSTPVPPDKTNKTPPSFAIDLSPADDIFFHGHLLPLHLLSHLPVSPRSSTNSLDSFTLPIRELIDDQKSTDHKIRSTSDNNIINNNNNSHGKSKSSHQESKYNNENTKGRTKSKSFSLFGFTRRKKGFEDRERDDDDKENNKQKKRLRFDVSHVIKKYMRMVRPLLFRGRRENLHFHSQSYSFSGNLSFRNKQDLRGRRGQFSAPASIRTSPTNSGLLLATTTTLPSSTSDSTMEELQAAIQAAIAHCKNSIAVPVEEKLKC